jgi:hypothetical protein
MDSPGGTEISVKGVYREKLCAAHLLPELHTIDPGNNNENSTLVNFFISIVIRKYII